MSTSEPFYDVNTRQWNMGSDTAEPRFSMETRLNEAATEAAGGVPKFDDVEYVEIINPGDLKNRPKRPVLEADRQRWAPAYKSWKSNQTARGDGVPIEELPGIAGSQARELRYRDVLTIEALSRLPDDTTAGLNVVELRERARSYLLRAREASEGKKAADARAEAEQRAATAEKNLAETNARLERLERLLVAQETPHHAPAESAKKEEHPKKK